MSASWIASAQGRGLGVRLAFGLALLLGPAACASAPLAHDAPGAGRGSRAVGWVRTQRVDLLSLRAQLELATGCRRSPKPKAGASVLRRAEISGANCRTRPYSGELEVFGVTHDGERIGPLWTQPVRNGALAMDFGEAELGLSVLGLEAQQLVAIELGQGAWAGTVQLDRLREFLGRWHYHWVTRGRGSPALFVAAHPEDPQAPDARAMAVEAQLARQERDYLDVGAGRLSPRLFLERHLWSPYRASVLRLEDRAIRAAGP